MADETLRCERCGQPFSPKGLLVHTGIKHRPRRVHRINVNRLWHVLSSIGAIENGTWVSFMRADAEKIAADYGSVYCGPCIAARALAGEHQHPANHRPLASEDTGTGLDAAWAKAEAALREGWWCQLDGRPGSWRASAGEPKWSREYRRVETAHFSTPAAALRALAARLATPEEPTND